MRKISRKRILAEIAAIAFSDFTKYVNVEDVPGEGQILAVTDSKGLSRDSKRAVCSIKAGTKGIEVKLHDKLRALELLGRAYGAFAADEDGDEATDRLMKLLETGEDFNG
ncbi:MAG: terminase small subunit [Oscillospiraceae bacterium]|nr:terminase small subunit [Oscillospiraceae bacterium]